MTRELGEEGFKQHKKDNFARGHRLHRFLVCWPFCPFSDRNPVLLEVHKAELIEFVNN